MLAASLGLGVRAAEQTAVATGQQGQGGRAGGGGRGGQQPARDGQTAITAGTGIISGVVTSAGQGAPVRRARVTLSGTELRGVRSTLTNDEGAFTFVALPPGRFTLTASKAGYVDIPFGAKRPGRPGTPIQLAADQKMERANIALPRGGVITGIVIDENGEPAPGTQVRVMRYVMRTGERQLQTAGQDQSDDRGMYRIYGLQPGEYLVSAVPRNQNLGDLRNTIAAEIEMVMQQLQATGLRGGGAAGGGLGAGGGGGRGARGGDMGGLGALGGRGGGDLMGRVEQLQAQLAQQEQQQAVAYAPVYYPGTASPAQSTAVTLAVGEERPGVDFQLRLVPTSKVAGRVLSNDGALPQGTQVSLMPLDQLNMPPIPGAGPSTTRTTADGSFTFNTVPPGQYRVMARGNVRVVEAGAEAQAGRGGGRGGFGGQGGRGGPGQIAQILWGSADISVSGQDVTNVTVSLQPGMTISGRVSFEGSIALPPTDLTRVRVSLQARGSQPGGDLGGLPQATVDATGNFKIPGVPPGRYTISASAPAGQAPGTAAAAGGRGGRGGGGAGAAPAGQWVLKSAMVGGRDLLDYPLDLQPNQEIGGALLTFVDRTQELTGTIQDTAGAPTADYTIILFPADKSFWVPLSRRIQSVRPGTDGRFTFRGIPAGDYRLTAVTDVEEGEWYDPAFLEQLTNASIAVSVRAGERKVQDMKVAAGGG